MKPRYKIIKEIEKYLLMELKRERGEQCEICGRRGGRLGLFHIFPKSTYPKLRFSKFNLLVACWMPCHYRWHHDYFRAKDIDKQIRRLRGEEYEETLLLVNKTIPKMTMFYLKTLRDVYKNSVS